jgi:hypothetical protein
MTSIFIPNLSESNNFLSKLETHTTVVKLLVPPVSLFSTQFEPPSSSPPPVSIWNQVCDEEYKIRIEKSVSLRFEGNIFSVSEHSLKNSPKASNIPVAPKLIPMNLLNELQSSSVKVWCRV